VALALLGRHEALDTIGEDDEADTVVVLDGAEGQERRDLRDRLHLGPPGGAEPLGSGEIDEEHHRHLALFGEDLHVRLVHAGRDVPVDEADVIPRLVLAHLAEGHAAALEDGVVAARELLVGEPGGADLDLLQLLDDFSGNHGQPARGSRGDGAARAAQGAGAAAG
jgi:hypothetical protein